MVYNTKQLLAKLTTNKVTFYKYFNIHKSKLEKLRSKVNGTYSYSEEFIKGYNELVNGCINQNEQQINSVNEVKTDANKLLLNELKSQYSEQIQELKQDKQFLQEKLSNQLDENKTQNQKIETLLIQLLKVSNDKNLIENKNLDPIQKSTEIVKEVKENLENSKKAKLEVVKEKEYLSKQLNLANEQAKAYQTFKKERAELIERLKAEYHKTAFIRVLKKAKLKKELEKAYEMQFNFIQYV